MKKDRNSFFSQYGYQYYNQPQQGMPFMGQGIEYQNQDIDSRLNRIEQELNRLDSRISKLESSIKTNSTVNNDYNFANSMYMV